MSEEKIQCNIRFTLTEIELGKKKAASLGMNFNKWIKYLVTREIESISEFGIVMKAENKYPKQMTAQEMIDADKKLIAELFSQTNDSPINPDTDLPY